MTFDEYGVDKVGDDPEVFWIIFADSSMTKGKAIMQTSGDLSEAELRGELAKMGLPVAHIDMLIARACAKWEARNTK